MCGVIRVASAPHRTTATTFAKDIEQVAEPLHAAGHATGIRNSGQHVQLFLEHEHVADVHVPRSPGRLRHS